MKKSIAWGEIVLYICSAILLACFAIFFILDCVRYSEAWSAPLEVALLLRAVEFLLPALLAFGGALLFKKINKNKNT